MRKQYVPDGKVLTEYFWDRSRIAIVQGPIGSGTSSASCMKIWAIACEQEPDYDGVRRTRFLIVRGSYRDLEETTLKTWLDWFPESVWGPMVRSQPMEHNLRKAHPSGDGTQVDCQVLFIGIDGPDTAEKVLASFEITGFFANEVQFMDRRVITELRSRCSRYPPKANGPGPTWFGGFCDLNAPNEGHWIPYMRGDLPFPADWTDEMRRVHTRPKDWKFFLQPSGLLESVVNGKVVYAPNPDAENQKWLSEPYIEKIAGWDKQTIDQRVMNRIGLYQHGQPVYPTFTPSDHIASEEIEPHPHSTIMVGLDFGRMPAAICCQNINGRWVALSELIGTDEPASSFAPRLKRHLAKLYPGMKFEFWGDPRGNDRTQADDTTAYEIFEANGMTVMQATTDNNPQLRRSALTSVLERRHGLKVNPSCITLKVGLGGGYHYKKVRGHAGTISPRPDKNNLYSHVCEALENVVIGGGEGDAVISSSNRKFPETSQPHRHRIQLKRHSWNGTSASTRPTFGTSRGG